jgi:hypothetical protein
VLVAAVMCATGTRIARFFIMARAKRGKRRIVVAVLPEIGEIRASERRAIERELRSGKRKPPLRSFRLKDGRQRPNN